MWYVTHRNANRTRSYLFLCSVFMHLPQMHQQQKHQFGHRRNGTSDQGNPMCHRIVFILDDILIYGTWWGMHIDQYHERAVDLFYVAEVMQDVQSLSGSWGPDHRPRSNARPETHAADDSGRLPATRWPDPPDQKRQVHLLGKWARGPLGRRCPHMWYDTCILPVVSRPRATACSISTVSRDHMESLCPSPRRHDSY